jgi:hypothetical protein
MRRIPEALLAAALLHAPAALRAQVGSAQAEPRLDAVRAAYHRLGSVDLERKRIYALPARVDFECLDATPKIRSASFGHKVTLLVPRAPDGGTAAEFYVEHGRSTNRAGAWFGPFPIR